MRTIRRRSFIIALVVGTSVVQAAGPSVVKSTLLTPQIKVDGIITDWTTLTSLTKEVSVAAANTHERLVIAIATSDASTKQRLLAAGLIVYLDANGKKAKTFGVRIPPAGGGVGAAGRFGNRGGSPPDPGGPPPARDPAGQQPAVTYVEVLGPAEKESHIVDLADRTGFEVARGENEGTLLIEVAIPLRSSDGMAFAAPIDPSQKAIGFGLVTPDISSQGRGQPGGGGRGGGRSGGGGMGGGMGRGGGSGGPPPDGARGPGGGQGKGLNAWTSIELARSALTNVGVQRP